MKKSFLMFGVAAMALASCTNEEVLNVADSRAIGFDAFVGKPTKAEITTDNLGTFQVYGGYVKTGTETTNLTNVWENVVVTKDGTWKAAGDPKYWVAGMTYQFAAYAPAAVGEPTVNDDNKNLDWTGIKADAANQNDFIYATASETTDAQLTTSPDNIAFTFGHQLAMIKVTFNSEFAAEYKVTISDLKVFGMNSTADFTGSDKTWSNHSGLIDEETGFSGISSANAQDKTAAVSDNFIVIPQTSAEKTMTVNFTATVFDEYESKVASHKFSGTIAPKWTNGLVYNYNVAIKPEGFTDGGEGEDDIFVIEFGDPTVDTWTEKGVQNGGDITVQ